MSRIRYFIFIVNLVFLIPISSQIEYDIIYVNNNKETKIIDSLKSLNNKSIFFFCPTLYYDSVIYKSKAMELVKSKKMSSINDLKIHFFLFKEDPINNSKGIPFKSIDNKQILSIGELECFFINFDDKQVQRARSKDRFNFEYSKPFKNENLYRIQIVDTNKCFKDPPYRIPFYSDFIKEAYSPSYSLEEKVDFLTDSIKSLQRNLNDLKTINETILIKLDSILKDNNISSPKKVKSEKIINQNPNKDQPQIPLENKPKDVIIDPNTKVNNKGKNK